MLCCNSGRAGVLTATHTTAPAGGKFFFESEVERLEANKQYVEAASKVRTPWLSCRAARSQMPSREPWRPIGFDAHVTAANDVSGETTQHTGSPQVA